MSERRGVESVERAVVERKEEHSQPDVERKKEKRRKKGEKGRTLVEERRLNLSSLSASVVVVTRRPDGGTRRRVVSKQLRELGHDADGQRGVLARAGKVRPGKVRRLRCRSWAGGGSGVGGRR